MKKLLLTMIVSFAFCGTMFAQTYSTHWPDFDYHQYADNKGLVAYVSVEGQFANADNYQRYEVAAFVGNECRGASFLQDETGLGDAHPAFQMQVYYDAQEGQEEQLSFKLYDHVADVEYSSCTPKFFSTSAATTLYTDNWYLGVWGEPNSNQAIVLDFASAETQTIELSEGWNWISLYVTKDDPVDMLDMLKAGLGDNAEEIQSFDYSTEYEGDGEWFGDLDEEGMYNEQMYMIKAVADCTVEVEGKEAEVSEYEIEIKKGWNWIGFPSAEPIDVAEAMADFEAEEGDEIQSKNNSTEFDGEEWFGDLETFVPGEGLMYFSNSEASKTLVFSTGAKKASRKAGCSFGPQKEDAVKIKSNDGTPIKRAAVLVLQKKDAIKIK